MTELKLTSPKVPSVVGWNIYTYEGGKYKKYPRNFVIESATIQFRHMLLRESKYERVEVRPKLKVDGL